MTAEQAIGFGSSGPGFAAAASIGTFVATAKKRYTELYDGYAFEVIVQKKRSLPERP